MKILLLEDDDKIASIVQSGLAQAGHSVEWVKNGNEGYLLATSQTFDAAIFDIMLPGTDGISVLKRLRAVNNPLPVLILSAKREVEDRVSGLQLGADDYLTKPFAFAELKARLEVLTRRAKDAVRSLEIQVGDLKLNIQTRRVFRSNVEIELQPREFELLQYLMENAGNVVSKAMVMNNVWKYNFDPQTSVVETRICKLRDKIDAPNQPPLIHTIRGAGYVLRNPN